MSYQINNSGNGAQGKPDENTGKAANKFFPNTPLTTIVPVAIIISDHDITPSVCKISSMVIPFFLISIFSLSRPTTLIGKTDASDSTMAGCNPIKTILGLPYFLKI